MRQNEQIQPRDKDAGLESCFIQIFKEHEYRLHTLALQLTKSDEYAKDIIQEVFLSLWDHRADIGNIHNMEAWLYRVTENKVVDFLRKAAVNSRLKQALWENLQDILSNETIELVEAKECETIISMAISTLPPQRQLIYRLNREKGLSYQQIAGELGVSRHTVKNQIFSAMQSIRKFVSRNRTFSLIIGGLFLTGIGIVMRCFVLFKEGFSLLP